MEPIERLDTDRLDDAIELLRETMGWERGERTEDFFRWKHLRSPFGESPGWIATDKSGDVIALRIFMRWTFVGEKGAIGAVRAVDTATRPDQQGKGWFRKLTLHGIEELTSNGTAFVFNTPNTESWPGYQKMGWRAGPSLSMGVRVARPGRLAAVWGARRAAAEKWADPTGRAPRAADFFKTESSAVERLLRDAPAPVGATHRTTKFLEWRYGFEPLGYQVTSRPDPAEGFIVHRTRTRGTAKELTVCDLVSPPTSARHRSALLAKALADSSADYAVGALATTPWPSAIPIPRLGPLLALRPLSATPPELELTLGDVELF